MILNNCIEKIQEKDIKNLKFEIEKLKATIQKVEDEKNKLQNDKRKLEIEKEERGREIEKGKGKELNNI